MRILIVTQYFWPENFRTNDLAMGLLERGHQVTVLTGIPNYPTGSFFPGYGLFANLRQDYHGAKIIRVPLLPRGKGRGIQLALNYLSFALILSVLAPFLCRGRHDVIFVCQLSPVTVGLPALILKKLKKLPIIFWILDLWPESLIATGAVRSETALRLVEKLVGFIYRGCDRILVASRGFVSSINAKGITGDRISYFPNWCEPEYGATHPLPVALPAGFRVMFAGNVGVAQDFETILSAAEKVKPFRDIHWIIVGDGRRLEWVREEVARRGLAGTLHLLGRYPPEAMAGFFAQADVMLVTLKRDPLFALTVPGKIQSYMACGRPIIAAVDGAGGELVTESGAGLSTPAEDPDALAQSVLIMYGMPKEKREAMGRFGKEYCGMNFEREMLIDRLTGWMQEVT